MRVIAGSARRILLKTIEGLDTRPTTDRIKETLFNMLQYELYDSTFLDLFAGSGGIGIESLSRGAKQAVFVEKNPRAVACIKENLSLTRLEDQSSVMSGDVLTALHKLNDKGQAFDFIFMDPPYESEQEQAILEYLANSTLLDFSTQIIVETARGTSFDYLEPLGLYLKKVKEYKTNQHVFIEKGGQ